jgi:hypothetical protein
MKLRVEGSRDAINPPTFDTRHFEVAEEGRAWRSELAYPMVGASPQPRDIRSSSHLATHFGGLLVQPSARFRIPQDGSGATDGGPTMSEGPRRQRILR